MVIQRAIQSCAVPILFATPLSLAFAPVPTGAPASGAPAAGAPAEPPPVDSALLQQLRQGGFVIFLRHAPTELGNIPDSAENIARCDTQRNLSKEGKKTAQSIGLALRKLRIPVGEVRSSPFCRCKDTAQLAFGRYKIDRNLYFTLNIHADARKQLTAATRQLLTAKPAPRLNTVLVSHSANLREAAGYWPKPEGTAYIFRPGPENSMTAVARMEPKDWETLAAASR